MVLENAFNCGVRKVIVVGIRHAQHQEATAAINEGFAEAIQQWDKSLVCFCNPLQSRKRSLKGDSLHCSAEEYKLVLRCVLEHVSFESPYNSNN